MRIYGASPFHNLADRVFRSRRLFILFIVVATAVTVMLAAGRAGQYRATAVLALSPAMQTGDASGTSAERRSAGYKLSVLSVLVTDPQFVRQALAAYGLTRGKSPAQVHELVSRALDAITVKSAGSGPAEIVDISCLWPGPEAAAIVSALCDRFTQHMLDEETALSHRETDSLQSLLALNTQRLQDIDRRIVGYEARHVGNMQTDWQHANAQYAAQAASVQDTQTKLMQAQASLRAVDAELLRTPRTQTDLIERQSLAQNPEYQRLLLERDQAETRLADLLKRYKNAHPKVIAARHEADQLNARIAAMEKAAPKRGQISSERDTVNPEYARLQTQRTALVIDVQSLKVTLKVGKDQLEQDLNAARQTPKEEYDYTSLTSTRDRYLGNRNKLAAQLDQAQTDEQRDRELRGAEMTLEVAPQPERVSGGAREALLIAIGPLLGLLVALAFSLTAESLDRSIRTPIDVERFLDKPVLAVLPRLSPGAVTRKRIGGQDATTSIPAP